MYTLKLVFKLFITKQEGTNRIIYAYGKNDPTDEDSIEYHGNTRGTKSISLLTPGTEPIETTDRVKHFDFFNQNVSWVLCLLLRLI